MTSNVSSFACLAQVVVIFYVCMSYLYAPTCFSCRHSRCSACCTTNVHYTAGATVVYHVFVCVVRYYSSTAFLCDTISMEEELLYLPRLPGSLTWSLQLLQCTKHVQVARNAACLAIQALLIWQRIYVRWYGSRLPLCCLKATQFITTVPFWSYTIHQAGFPGLFNNF